MMDGIRAMHARTQVPDQTMDRPRVTLFMSISLNGMIARPDGREDFFTGVNWTAFVELAKSVGTLAWGRRTHEIFRGAVPDALDGVRGFVLTTDPAFEVEPGWAVADSPQAVLAAAHAAGATEVLVVGGALVNSAFAEAGAIDRVILDVESVLVGQGIPLFEPAAFDLQLQVEDVQRISPTVLQLHYKVTGRTRGDAERHHQHHQH